MASLRRTGVLLTIGLLVGGYIAVILLVDRGRRGDSSHAPVLDSVPAPRAQPALVLIPGEAEVLRSAAQRAWRFVDRNYHERTGLVSPLDEYPVTTVWDMGSAIAAHFSARELGLISDSVYLVRVTRMLDRIAVLPLFAGVAFNKRYYSTSIGMAGPRDEPSSDGYGWSAIDIGRLLLWLDIVRSRDNTLAPAAERAARRIDIERVTRDGEMLGGMARDGSVLRYQEGRLGYEQYAARGFERWGADVGNALDLLRNAQVVQVGDDRLLGDLRKQDCLTSDPFVMLGLEVGWDANEGRLAQSLLRAQQARFEQTGALTAVSEDALFAPPHHFYYYCALAGGSSFIVLSPTNQTAPSAPRTVSTKAAFGWYALIPNSYTTKLLSSVIDAANAHDGWPSAFHERTHGAAGGENINTAAVILEAAAYVARGRSPLARRSE